MFGASVRKEDRCLSVRSASIAGSAVSSASRWWARPGRRARRPPSSSATSTAASSGGDRYGTGGGRSAGGSPAASLVINLATTSLGPVLIGPNGPTLYTHSGDTATSSSCTGGCATAWPPLSVAAGAKATGGTGVTGTLGTLTRADGNSQVTYNGLPLYGWRIAVSTLINRPLQEVWDFSMDLSNSSQWTASGSELRQTSTGPPGVANLKRLIERSALSRHDLGR